VSDYLEPTDTRYTERERGLILIGREAIAVENDAALDAYFASGYALHGPAGTMGFDDVKAFFASMRAAFRDFRCERRELVSRGDLIAARTAMSGIFEDAFTSSPVGVVQPNGAPMAIELINFFRYDADGRLAEEWVQFDNLGMLKQIGVLLRPAALD
jgi:predicted ester cyclase